jgi:enoyl-CoA hydratase/carnithine racemase
MVQSDVLIQKKERVGWLILNRPEQRNTLSSPLMRRFLEALEEMDSDGGVGAIVLRGAGDQGFCAGADLREWKDMTQLQHREFFGLNAKILTRMGKMTKPLIASVHGYAMAGGLGIATGCDIVLASEDALLGATEVNIGAAPMVIMAPIFRCVSRHIGLKMILSGEIISAKEAQQIGLVNQVYPKEKLEEATLAMANELASKSPITLRLIREAYYTMSDMEYFKAMEYLREMIAITASTKDCKEGITAFLEKRKPNWKGE